MEHEPKAGVEKDGYVVRRADRDTYQYSCHIAKYQKAWIDTLKSSDERQFNFSSFMRKALDAYIAEHEVDLPDEVLIEETEAEIEAEPEGIEVFITND